MSSDSARRDPSYYRQDQNEEQQGYPMARAIAIAFLIAAYAIPIVYAIRLPHQGMDGAYAVGYLSGPLLPLLAILLFATRSAKRIRDVLLLILAVLACIWSALNCYRTWEDSKALHSSVNNIKQIMDSIDGKGNNVADAPQPSEERTTVSGENGKLAAVMNAMAANIKHFSQRVQAIQAKGEQPEYAIDTVLSPDNFTDPARLADSRRRVASFRELVKERQQACSDYIKDAETIIRNADASDKTREDMMGGFEHARKNVVNGFKRLDDAQLGLMQTVSEMHDLAQRGMGKNTVKGDKIIFSSEADLAAYQQGMTRVNQFAKDEEAAQQGLQNQSNDARSRLDTIGQ